MSSEVATIPLNELVIRKVGRPLTFGTPELLLDKFDEWKQEFKPGGLYDGDIPDVECFCDYIDSYRNLFNEYEKREEFSGAIKQIKNWMAYRKKQMAMKNQMNATIYIFDAKNNHGYVDKTEVDNRHEVVQPILGGSAKQIPEESDEQAS